MRNTVALLFAFLSLVPAMSRADGYTKLWDGVKDAENRDLPRTQIERLQAIAEKAEKEAAYGHLLKAECKMMWTWGTISTDSLAPRLERLERKADSLAVTDPALAAVYYSVLGKAYADRAYPNKGYAERSEAFYKKSMASPALLASKTATDYEPFVIRGRDSRIFNNDLLSLLGYAAKDYETMHAYYATTDNRAATMITALEAIKKRHEEKGWRRSYILNKSEYAVSLDSLINLYSDLKECGEVAIERYNHMKKCSDVKPENLVGYINKATARWGEWPHINVLRNELKRLTRPEFMATMPENAILPEHDGEMRLVVRNVDKITVSITKVNVAGDTKLSPINDNEYKTLRKSVVAGTTRVQTLSYIGHPDYEEITDTVKTGKLPVGVYLVEITASDKNLRTQRALLHVTDMFAVYQMLPGNKLRVAALSGTTGQPVPGAEITLTANDNKKRTMTCDSKGEAVFDMGDTRLMLMRAYTPEDNSAPFASAWSYFSFYNNDQTRETAKLFTDRSIYRPGQTVHVAGILTSRVKIETKAVEGRSVTLYLKDAKYRSVKEISVRTDEFGSFSADFQLPSSVLTGAYSIRTDNRLGGYAGISVEEYKRPTFTVEFPEINQKYNNGDTLVVTAHAKSYAGVPVQGAKVSYTVRRTQPLWWRFSQSYIDDGDGGDDVLFTGEGVTDSEGAFKVEMPMLLPAWSETSSGGSERDFFRIARFYTITAEADVTDQGGETRHGSLSLPLSTKATSFSHEIPEKIVLDSLKTITFRLRNAAGNDVEGDVRYRVDSSEAEFTAKTNRPAEVSQELLSSLKPGRHTLTAVCAGDTLRHEFILFGLDDTVPCVETPDWFYVSAETFPADGSPVRLQVGSSDADVHILYTAISGDKVIESGAADISNGLFNRKLIYKEEYGDGLLLNFIWVKGGKVYSHNVTINRPLPDKNLTMKWSTFRDRLTPGQKEEWTLSITKPDGTPADAQLMATMYDASLDQIKMFSWAFKPDLYLSLPSTQWGKLNYYGISMSRMADLKLLDENALIFNTMDIGTLRRSIMVRGRSVAIGAYDVAGNHISIQKHSEAAPAGEVLMAKEASKELSDVVAVGYGSDKGAATTGSVEGPEDMAAPEGDVPLRENLNETAFFYPALRTDTTGNVSISFTLPESVTTWKFMGFAHDRDVNSGIITAETVAKKDIMIQPNMPRFIRMGDKATISARIFNTSEKPVKGTAVMQLTDPDTEKVVYTQKKTFSVEAGATTAVTFDYSPANTGSLLVCKTYATGKDFSDGEQHYLPVLSDEELVTNTVPFTQNTPGVKTIDINKLFPSGGRKERLTVEYTNNPAWLTIQALPYIGTPSGDNSVSLATTYYANSLAAYIMKQSPRIKSVFEQWKNEERKESLSSSLEQNQELKDIVLDETPWTVNADNEEDQKLRLANYFDSATLENNLSSTLSKLQKLQKADGSWCWWSGMKWGSPVLTATIVEMLTRLNTMTGDQAQTRTMLDKAFSFLGKTVVEKVKELRKAEKEGHPYIIDDNTSLQYLYICSLDGRKLTADERDAADYLLAHLKENNAKSTLYRKALMAVVLAQRGETKLAGEYLKSLDEYSVNTEEMGRYYDSPRAAYSWLDYRIPTQVAVIEAMTLVDAQGYAKSIGEMKLWLLQQKRVQGWDTPVNSVNAVYTFLNGNTSVLANQDNTVLAVDGKQLDMPGATAGMGYVKAAFDGRKGNIFTATKTSEGTSWGAVYAQSVQKTSSVAISSAGFSVTREVLSADGRPQTAFKTGDKVKVRITIKADRDYDFVQIKDKRAACMEPVTQLSGYRSGYYCAPKDNSTNYYFDRMSKGTHVIETEYYIDRTGKYETGTCTVQCAYAPEYSARAASCVIEVK